MHINNYSNTAILDKVIAKIKWSSFLPHSVVSQTPPPVATAYCDGMSMTTSLRSKDIVNFDVNFDTDDNDNM